MTPDELDAIKRRYLAYPRACGVCMGHSPERDGHDLGCGVPIIQSDVPALIAALREAWAEPERIAQEIEAAHRTAPDCCAYDVAASIARRQG